MELITKKTPIRDILLVEQQIANDQRGSFQEIFNKDSFATTELPNNFAQINQTRSHKNVIRGLHFQWQPPMAKLMRVTRGKAFLVAVDIRKGSPTLGQWFGTIANDWDGRQLFAPAGCARGFCALSEPTEVEYLCTATYNTENEAAIAWNDPEIAIAWPIKDPLLSKRDQMAVPLSVWLERKEADLFSY